jgi:Uma2 family endonuclease
MPIRPFFDRANELAALDRALLDRRIGKMALLYGRRRIGKTYLLQHFVSERADDAATPDEENIPTTPTALRRTRRVMGRFAFWCTIISETTSRTGDPRMPVRLPAKSYAPERSPTPKRWTRKECADLVENEMLIGRYELIDGEIISKMGQKPPHALTVMILTGWLVGLFGHLFVRFQLPIDVSEADNLHNEPEPDAVVLARPGTETLGANPKPADVLLAIEIADSSLRFDLRTKAALYARAGIEDYWVIDIPGRRIVVHREPSAGRYRSGRPDAEILASALLPPMA